MKYFIIHELTREKEVLEYNLKTNFCLSLVLILSQDIDADVCLAVRLIGKGASANVMGLVIGRGNHHISIHTEQIHEAPETTSNLVVKSALGGHVQFSYDGMICITRAAQKSDAYQRNDNLLLSEGARARSDPALEILANDVRCTHGSTTGKINEDQLWYLTSRGLSNAVAIQLLIEGFFQHATETISDTISREKIRRLLWQPT